MKNLWLLFKQGFRSLFEFKIQFVVILLLTFFSSFYLVSMTSLNYRMKSSYNNIVQKFEKFDYTYKRELNESSLLDSNMTFIPILDLIPTQTNYFINNNTTLNDSFNLVLNDFGGYYEKTFITKALFDDEMNPTQALKDAWNINDTNYWSQLSRFFVEPGKQPELYQGQKFSYKYGEKIENFETFTDYKVVQRAIFTLTKAFSKEISKELVSTKKSDYFKNSLINQIWEKNNMQIDKDFSEIKMTLPSLAKDPKIWMNEYKKEISSKGDFQNYIYNALESVSYYIVGSIIEFLNNSYANVKNQMSNFNWEEPGKTMEEKTKDFEEKFNKIAEEQGQMKIYADLKNSQYSESEQKEALDPTQWNKRLAFEYIFGTSFDGEIINPDYIVNTNNLAQSTYQIKTKNEKPIDNKLTIEKNGMRGLVNPASVTFTTPDNYFVSSKNELSAFERINKGEIYNSKLTPINKEYKYVQNNDNYYDWSTLYSYNFMHQRLAAELHEIDLQIREEAFYFDKNSSQNFRFVILNDDYDYNFQVTDGLPVMQENEIIISQQYALKNGYRIGDKINIAGINFIISGFGADALTYYPLVDPEVPVVDIKNSAIVYVPKYVVNKIANKNSSKDFSFFTYYFTKRPESMSETEFKKNMMLFDYELKSDNRKFSQDLEKLNAKKINLNNWNSTNQIKTFESTNFNLNWSLQPKILKIVNLITIISSGLILLLALISVIYGILKTVKFNSTKIAILKAQGVNSFAISISYLWYSIFISLIVIPIAWISAGFFQEILASIVSNYFSTTLYRFIWDYRILVLLIVVLGVLTLIISYFVTFFLTSKSYITIINNNVNKKSSKTIKLNLLNKIVGLLTFKVLFPMKLAIRGYKQVVMLVLSIFVITSLITVSIVTPIMLNIYIKDADKYFNYNDEYNLNNSVAGLPTSKSSLTASRGIDNTEKLYSQPKILGKNGKKLTDIYFDNNKYYNDSNWDSSIMPIIMYGEGWTNKEWVNDFNWTEKWIFDENLNSTSNEENSKLLKLILPIIGQIGNINGISLSPGTFEKIASYVWNTSINPNTGYDYFEKGSQILTQEQVWEMKAKSYESSISFFQMAIKQIVHLLASGSSSGNIQIPQGSNWKEDIMLLASSLLPNSLQQYYKKSPNSESQFNISINSENYVPGEESLSTEVKTEFNDDNFNISGLKNNQSSFVLDNKQKEKVFVSDDEVLKLNKLFNEKENYSAGDIFTKTGFKIYDMNSKTLNIPLISNLKMLEKYNLSNGLKIDSFNYKTLKIGNSIVPKNAWIYDNREITHNLSKFDKNLNLADEKDWISASEIDPNKYTYTKEFEYDQDYNISSIRQDSKWFINAYSKNGLYNLNSIDYNLRPYYHYNNLKLFVPSNIANMPQLLNGENASHSRKSNFAANDWKSNIDLWHATVSKADVPEQVLQAWGNDYSNVEQWEWISPFSILYSKGIKDESRKGWINNIETDLQEIYTWAGDKIKARGVKDDIYVSNVSQIPSFLNSVKVTAVDTINTYNGNVLIADQDIVNLLTNRSTDKYIPVDYDYYGEAINEIPNGQLNYQDHAVTVRKMKSPIDILKESRKNKRFFMKDDLMKDNLSDEEAFEKVIQNRDFNNKYSGLSQTYGITNAIKSTVVVANGVLALSDITDGSKFNNLSTLYNKVTLVEMQLGVIKTATESIILISGLMVIGIVFISIMVIALICDIYIMRYHHFLLTMRSLGYSNKSLICNTLMIPIVFSILTIVLGYIIGFKGIGLLSFYATKFGIFIPVVVYWWIPLLIVISMIIIIFIAIAFSLRKPLNGDLKKLT
ncbi:ABC transporter permease [Mesoplasma coleopterae]|uniref:ABC transporter permease n=1 Tax=Mesoplasma coleopterae TaxID=324078 RepID=UPI000D037C4F|nr:ABC transporter permease [Mesoplasma coleopterae]AVN63138.1 hypothetical protein CG000_02415 [Mesoplasma coleopterae]